jgi:hypothetical protein
MFMAAGALASREMPTDAIPATPFTVNYDDIMLCSLFIARSEGG